MASKRRIRIKKPDTFKHYDLVIYAARGSNSARTLATALSCRRWRDDLPERYTRRRAYFRGKPYPMVVNWGSTVRPDWGTIADVVARCESGGFWINPQEAVGIAIDKLKCFDTLTKAEVPCLKYTTDKAEVEKWLKKHSVIARSTVTGSGGEGISILEQGNTTVPSAKLYTRNFPKTHEFRVHVFNGEVIDIAEKKAKVGSDGRPLSSTDRVVRSHANGWVFAHEGLSLNTEESKEAVRSVARRAVDALGLCFGAVDVLAILDTNHPRSVKNAVVCEVNTGPGLENSTTIEAYKKAILKLFKEKGRS